MSGKNITLRWIGGWVMITILTAWWAQQTQESWTFYIVIASFAILVGGLLGWGNPLRRWFNLKRTKVSYYIPKASYPRKTFSGAPDEPQFPTKLTVGIGTYDLMLGLKMKVDANVEQLIPMFDDKLGQPEHMGRYHDALYVKLPNDSFLDWYGHPTIQKEYPYPLRPNDFLPDCYRIRTTAPWHGELHVEIHVGQDKLHRKLDFLVSKDHDDIPFLKVQENKFGYSNYPPTNDIHQAGSTLP